MNLIRRLIIVLAGVFSIAVGLSIALSNSPKPDPDNIVVVDESPGIHPDYSDTVIPANIAPLNFLVREKGDSYFVRIHSEHGNDIEISGRKGNIVIRQRKWRQLLEANRGNELYFDVYVKNNSRWKQYRRVTNTIAKTDIDGHLAYRLIIPMYHYWRNVGIYQRDLSSFDESLILHGSSFEKGCVNCHSFLNNDPDQMFIGIRSAAFGSATLQVRDGNVTKIGTKFGHTAWHPSGRIAAYSMYDVRMFHHSSRRETRDVIEMDSLLAYYLLDDQEIKTVPAISDKDQLETQPAWSPDGKYLYFVSSPKLWSTDQLPPDRYAEVKYDMKRISYDVDTDTWGQPETILSAKETGLSILTPRVSPDGRYVAFVMCQYSCFGLYHGDSDLYMLDVETGDYERLSCNSDYAESWHSWSTNGRWMVFSSKRDTEVFTRLFITHIDQDGKSSKPFILPQKDPCFYDSYLKAYNIPELITGPVNINKKSLVRAVRSPAQIEVDSVTKATPGKINRSPDRWQQRSE